MNNKNHEEWAYWIPALCSKFSVASYCLQGEAYPYFLLPRGSSRSGSPLAFIPTARTTHFSRTSLHVVPGALHTVSFPGILWESSYISFHMSLLSPNSQMTQSASQVLMWPPRPRGIWPSPSLPLCPHPLLFPSVSFPGQL